MLKITPEPTFIADVPISIPGKAIPEKVPFEFKYMGVSELDSFSVMNKDTAIRDLLPIIVVGWSGIDVPFSIDNLAKLVNAYPSATASIFQTFIKESTEAKTKN